MLLLMLQMRSGDELHLPLGMQGRSAATAELRALWLAEDCNASLRGVCHSGVDGRNMVDSIHGEVLETTSSSSYPEFVAAGLGAGWGRGGVTSDEECWVGGW